MRQTNVCSNRVFVQGFTQAHEGLKWRRRRRRRRRERHMLKNNFNERKHFIRRYQRNSRMDFSELWPVDSLHSEGTNTLVMGGLGCVKRGHMNEHH